MTALKAFAAVVATVLVAIQTAILDGVLSPQDVVVIVSSAVTALGVYIVPNTPLGKASKFVVAALGAALMAGQTAISDGTIIGGEWITIVLVFLGALGVYAVPNKPSESRAVDYPPSTYHG